MAENTNDPALSIPNEFREDEEMEVLLNSGDVQKLRKMLGDGEVVERLVLCKVSGRDAVLAATNERIIFCDKLFIGADVITFEYRQIAAVIYHPQLITHKITLAHAEGSVSVEGVDMEHGKRFIEYIRDLIGGDYKAVGKSRRALEHRGEMLALKEIPSMEARKATK